MSASFIIIPIVFVLFGIACLIFPRQIGVGFCRLGKLSWRAITFGLTDMRRFYPEDKAPALFRMFGFCFLAGGILFLVLLWLSFSGPGSLFAMREASIYLDNTYGDTGGNWSISASKDKEDATKVTVTYQHGNASGALVGEWDGTKYIFSEKK